MAWFAKKCSQDGFRFDSMRERSRYQELRLLADAGAIACLEVHSRFELAPAVKLMGESRTKPALTYVSDYGRWFERGEKQMSISKEVKPAKTESRKISLAAGVLYLLTFVSVPTLALYGQVKGANYIIGAGPDTAVIIGGVLEIIVALAGIGTAVVLFPVLKKQNESFALGLVAARILESSTIFVGVAFLLSIVTLRQAGAGADALVTGHALVALYDRIFLLGQSFMPAVCDLLLGFLLYKSRLVPRALSLIGIVGAPLLVVGYIAVLFGLIGRLDPLAALAAVPVALFEFSLGVWLVVKGFNPSAVTALEFKK